MHQNDGWVCLMEKDEIDEESGCPHDTREILRPSPSETLHDESSDGGGDERSGEDSHGEDDDGEAPDTVVVHVRQHGGHHGQWACTEESTKEAA